MEGFFCSFSQLQSFKRLSFDIIVNVIISFRTMYYFSLPLAL